jgi:hexosaminidase
MKNLTIIPLPASVKYTDGIFFCKGLPKITADSCFKPELAVFRGQMKAVFPKEDAGTRLTVTQALDKKEKAEWYKLTITPEDITIEAAEGAGIYHGLQTLRQLFMTQDAGGIPCVVIEDAPQFPWRGFMLDCSRNFFTVEFVKKVIDAISMHHINKFHWHLTDDQGWRLPIEKYPLLIEIGSKRYDTRRRGYYGGFYTTEDIKAIVAWAAERHVEVVPEVDLPGHTSSVLAAYPGLGCTGGPYKVEDRYGVFDEVLCAGNDGLWDLSAAVFDTLVDLFPSKYVHIGGDEVRYLRWSECPKCRAKMQEWGMTEAFAIQPKITTRLVAMLAERGKIAIGWDEVIDDKEAAKTLPQDLVVMSWRGRGGGDAAVKLGHRVIMTPNSEGCYLDYQQKDSPDEPGPFFNSPLSKLYALNPVSAGMSREDAALILGAQGNLWTEQIVSAKLAEYMAFPRICALAEALWTPCENKNFEDFQTRLTTHNQRLELLDLLYCRY